MKRGAELYITKEHGSTPNSGGVEEQRTMATAAQQARRKIIQPKSRTGRSTTPTSSSSFGGQSQSSPFQLGGSAQNTSQSFPQPSQSQSFNFSVPNASFNFGSQQNGPDQSFSNPFTNLNGNGGANGGAMAQENSMNCSQPQQSGGLFNFASSTSQSAPATDGWGFGQSQLATGGSNAFGGGSSVFGQKAQEQPASSGTGLFGSQPQTNGFAPSFGQSTSAAVSPSLFSQTSGSTTPTFGGFGGTLTTAQDSLPVPAPAPTFKFGETTVVENKPSTPQPEESTTPKSKPSFSFGQTASFGNITTNTSTTGSPAPASGGFGQSATPDTSTSTPTKSLFSFAKPADAAPQPQSEPAKPLFSFGQPATSMPQPPNNLFGSISKPAESISSTSLFGRASPADEPSKEQETKTTNEPQPGEESQQPKNPFATLFVPKKSDIVPDSDAAKPKPLFSFGQPATTTSDAPKSSPSTELFLKPATTLQQPAAMAQSNSPSSTPNASSGGLFSPKPPTTSTISLFNLNKPTPSAESSTQEQMSQKVPSFFGSNTTNAGSTPFKPSQTFEPQDDAPPAKRRLFNTSTARENMAREAGVVPGPLEPVQPKFTQPQKPQSATEQISRAVSTEGPPSIPRHLNADKYKSYDENWRLKALNRQFQRSVTSANVDTQDFASLVQNYLDHREAIGDGLVQFMRKQTAGSKRKATDVDDMQEDDAKSKKTKPSGDIANSKPTSNNIFGSSSIKPAATTSNIFAQSTKPTPTASNIFGSVPSPKPATTSTSTSTGNSATANLFKNMIPGATTLPSFGSTPAKSTTPPSSPPKSAPQPSKFEVPKFGAAAGDFASAFASKAEKSAAQLKRTSAEKRKSEDFDSDEDDADEWARKDEEAQRAKKAKIEAAAKGGFGFIPSASTSRSNSPFAFASNTAPAAPQSVTSESREPVNSIENDDDGSVRTESIHEGSGNSGDDEHEQEQEADDGLPEDAEEEGEPIPDLPKTESLFSRVEKPAHQEKVDDEPILQSARKDYYKPGLMFDHIGKSSPDQPAFSPFTPATVKQDFVPTTTFHFNATKPATLGNSSSVFGGGPLREGPIPGEGLFGSRPTTPQPANVEKAGSNGGNIFASSFGGTKPISGSDNTWTKGSPIKFGTSTGSDKEKDTAAPTIEVSAATPPTKGTSKPLFGTSTGTPGGFFGAATSNGASVGFSFGTPSTSADSPKPAPGFLSAASHLGASPGLNSRGSSPGIPSEAESNLSGTDAEDTNEHASQPQLDLKSANAGEEDESAIFEAKASLSRSYNESDLPENTKFIVGWNKIGSGFVRVLKHNDTNKCRIVFRTEPGANVLLNTRLISGVRYASEPTGKQGAVRFLASVEGQKDGQLGQFLIRVGSKEKADEMAKACEDNKAN
ncbi:hypothetical protein LTR05_008438 [Lithohypha guttulata]|uniref:RanBD1 domain-containing protein n=1 Tax=Lithohypha guttulata TaxID=1690604 RepID=A0AAN7Q7G5_9EURO|nr:hypothetical protein LTR05_008438 [Lithohypha guttulata]